MSRSSHEFRYDGIPKGLSYAYKKGADISSAHTLIAAPSVSTHSIVITDIVFSKSSAGTLTLTDGSTDIMDMYAATYGSNSVNFTGPLKLTAGNAFKITMDDTNTDYGVLVTYYLTD